jgi:hypothetical protein
MAHPNPRSPLIRVEPYLWLRVVSFGAVALLVTRLLPPLKTETRPEEAGTSV